MDPIDEGLFRDFVADCRAIDYLLETNRNALLDDLPGRPEDIAAKKLRRGCYLTTFNAMEGCLKKISFHICGAINRCNISTAGMPSELKSAIFRGISDGIASTPSWVSGGEKVVREVRFASAIQGFYNDSVVRLEGDQFFTNSNISASQYEMIPKLIKRIYDSVVSRDVPNVKLSTTSFSDFFVEIGTYLDPDCVNGAHGPEVGSKKLAKVIYSNMEFIRNRSAHENDFSPTVDQIIELKRQATLICVSYAIYCSLIVVIIEQLSSDRSGVKEVLDSSVSLHFPCYPDKSPVSLVCSLGLE